MIVFSLGALNFYNKGFKSRYAEDFKNFSINFNIKELEEETALFKENLRLKNEFYSNNKKKVLIIGNSVAIDLLMSFDQNIDFLMIMNLENIISSHNIFLRIHIKKN